VRVVSDPLWAPWRMEYILSKKEGGCVFCAYAKAADHALADAHVLAATAHAYVVLNRYPFAAGHLLVIPNRHESTLERLPLEEYEALMRLAREAAIRLRSAVGCQGMNVGINLGQAAGAGIAEHLHVHVVPRWEGDTNFMPVIADVRVMPQHLTATYQHLITYFRDLPGSRLVAT
jgi:ATP adenylyltransferase